MATVLRANATSACAQSRRREQRGPRTFGPNGRIAVSDHRIDHFFEQKVQKSGQLHTLRLQISVGTGTNRRILEKGKNQKWLFPKIDPRVRSACFTRDNEPRLHGWFSRSSINPQILPTPFRLFLEQIGSQFPKIGSKEI